MHAFSFKFQSRWLFYSMSATVTILPYLWYHIRRVILYVAVLSYIGILVSRKQRITTSKHATTPACLMLTRNPQISKSCQWLIHKGQDKLAPIFGTTFSNAFYWIKPYQYRIMFHWSLFPRVQSIIFQHWSIGSDNGLAPGRRQAFIWTNDGSFTGGYMRHSASMS